jgi:hypothetical protein
VVELQDIGREGQRAEHRVLVGRVALGDERRAHLRAVDARAHQAAADLGEQLRAQADAQGREVGRQRLAEQVAHGDELRALLRGVQRRLRPPEYDQPVVVVEGGRQLLPQPRPPLVELHAGVAQPRAEPGERIGLVDDGDEQAVHVVERNERRPRQRLGR